MAPKTRVIAVAVTLVLLVKWRDFLLHAFDEVQAREIARLLKKRQVETVAVCFVNSYANPAHETRMREILAEELPGVNLCTSAEILPEIFEYERFNTTAANAVLAPLVTGYVDRLSNELATDGYRVDDIADELDAPAAAVRTRGRQLGLDLREPA